MSWLLVLIVPLALFAAVLALGLYQTRGEIPLDTTRPEFWRSRPKPEPIHIRSQSYAMSATAWSSADMRFGPGERWLADEQQAKLLARGLWGSGAAERFK